jgi:hypothetical protein
VEKADKGSSDILLVAVADFISDPPKLSTIYQSGHQPNGRRDFFEDASQHGE